MLSRARVDKVLGRRGAGAWPLHLLVLALGDRCDQRCAHCAIWSSAPGAGLDRAQRLALVDEALSLGVRGALLTGGEPLLSRDFAAVAERLHAGGARVVLATNGRLIAEHLDEITRYCAEVYVSLDGASAHAHDALRGAPTWGRLAEGLALLRARGPSVQCVARCTLHGGNLGEIEGVVAAARRLGFHHVSFLPLDASSAAFGDPEGRQALVPSPAALVEFERAVRRLSREGALSDGFVLESEAKLLRIAAHLRASGAQGRFETPPCDAPWWSLVVGHDGAVRPCFFQAPVGEARQGLDAVRSSAAYGAALAEIRRGNPTCERCVCPSRAGGGRAWRLARAAVGREARA
jgi:Fe-coproporphyrin III synthase